MFIVFNKDKIFSYIILLSTVAILFGIAFNVNNSNTMETSANIEKNINNSEIMTNSEYVE